MKKLGRIRKDMHGTIYESETSWERVDYEEEHIHICDVLS